LFGEPAAAEEAEEGGEDMPADDPFGKVEEPQPQQVVVRHWVDNTGLYEIDGRLIEITDVAVRILKDNGRTCTVPLRRLSTADADYVQQIAATYGQGLVGPQLASR
jgi:hypothetical protein